MGRWRVSRLQPPSLRTAAEMLWFMSSNPVLRQKDAPSLAKTDEVLDKFVEQIVKTDDANDVLYALEASHDYDPGPNLEKIRAPLLAINSADDLINPPELGILEREIKRVPKGRAIVIPFERQNAWPRQPHTCRVVERSVGAVAQGNGKVNADIALRRSHNQEGCRAGAPACPSVDSASEALALQRSAIFSWQSRYPETRHFGLVNFHMSGQKSQECPQRCCPQRGIAPLLPRVGQLCVKQPIRRQHRSTRSVRLSELCQIYWRPVYRFPATSGHSAARCAGSHAGIFC